MTSRRPRPRVDGRRNRVPEMLVISIVVLLPMACWVLLTTIATSALGK